MRENRSFGIRRGAFAAALSLAVGSVGVGCGEGFTPDEMTKLQTFALPAVPASPTNSKADDAGAAKLGQKFFFDTRFSGALVVSSDLGTAGQVGKVACSSCHDPSNGGSDQRSNHNTSLAAGFTGRNAPTVYNAAYNKGWMFWDGRKDSVWAQALGPPESGVEHNGTRLQYVHLINDAYKAEYEAVFGALPANISSLPATGKPGDASFDSLSTTDKTNVNRIYSNFGKAIEAYERLLVDKDSKFDKYLAGDHSQLSDSAIRGAKLFIGKAGCATCHSGGNFSDGKFHNIGVSQTGENLPTTDRGRAAGIAQVLEDAFNRGGAFSDQAQTTHLTGLTATAADEGAFKTPTLRSVSKTAPYMHTGTHATLRDVIKFYAQGGGTTGYVGTKDDAIGKIDLTDAEIDDLVEFLKSLDGAPLPASLTSKPT